MPPRDLAATTRSTSASSGGGSGMEAQGAVRARARRRRRGRSEWKWTFRLRASPKRCTKVTAPHWPRADAPLLARATPQRREDRAHEDAQHGARERRVVGEAVAEGERQREHPLADRDLGQHAVHQVRGRVGHAPAAAGRAEAAALAGEGDDAVEAAVVAVHAHEAVGEDAAAEEAAELALDEARHRALARLRAGQEGLELALDDAVEDALLGAAAGVLLRVAAPTRVVAMRGADVRGSSPRRGVASFVPGVIRAEGARRGEPE